MMTTTYIISTFPYILHSDSHGQPVCSSKDLFLLRAVYTPKTNDRTSKAKMDGLVDADFISPLHRIFTHGPTRYTESCRPQAYVSSRVVVKIAPFKMYSVKSFIHIHHSISYEFCWSNHFKSFECC